MGRPPALKLLDGRRLPISCEAGIPVQMPPPGPSQSSRASGRRNSWLAPSKSSLLSSFFLNALDSRASTDILFITVLVRRKQGRGDGNTDAISIDGILQFCYQMLSCQEQRE